MRSFDLFFVFVLNVLVTINCLLVVEIIVVSLQ